MDNGPSFMTLRTRRPHDGSSLSSADSTYGSATDGCPPATHDISRVSYHVKHLETFVSTLQDSANRAFPNRGRSSQRYSNVQAILLHWKSDDLFVLPELEDLDKTLREEYNFETDIFAIPSENSHLELMLKIGELIKRHEGQDTLFVVYYGGHAKIDESRQSTWCATRHPSSPWLQWSAIQTLLERSASDVLILLDCCAGAASATFPNGKSITETISASSWDAIAPDPGRYSFTNALIEVLQEWRTRTFSAAMLHAEVLARLKHPRPILINGKHFEARSTPVHFMMTSNHKAPSIEFARVVPDTRRPVTPPLELPYQLSPMEPTQELATRSTTEDVPNHAALAPEVTDPNEDTPHVMISLALEDDQRLDLNAWEQWLANFPALAKYVKIQGVFQSHSTLLLLSLPVMVWDLLPDDPAYSFVAFIRSNNLLRQSAASPESVANTVSMAVPQPSHASPLVPRPGPMPLVEHMPGNFGRELDRDTESIGGTTLQPDDNTTVGGRQGFIRLRPIPSVDAIRPQADVRTGPRPGTAVSYGAPAHPAWSSSGIVHQPTWGHMQDQPASWGGDGETIPTYRLQRQQTAPSSLPGLGSQGPTTSDAIARTVILNQSRSSKRTIFTSEHIPEGPPLASHVVQRLEDYYQKEPEPSVAVAEFFASNLGVETDDIRLWFHHRREQEKMNLNLWNLRIDDPIPEARRGAQMILAGQLNNLLEIFPSKSVLVIDLRPSTDYEKSHIYDAINLRTPLSFVDVATLEMIQDTFVDNHSQRNFAKWNQSRCIVFYDRMVEYTWECPVADALLDKLKRKGWPGQCFILKGHYKEFSVSFDKYISGTKMSQQAKDYTDSLRQQSTPPPEEADQKHKEYDQWLWLFNNEDRANPVELVPAKRVQRAQAVEQHQQELEMEFETRFPALYRKAQALRPAAPPSLQKTASVSSDRAWEKSKMMAPPEGKWTDRESFDLKAGLVGHLDRGLEKMREAGGIPASYSAASDLPAKAGKETYTDKLGDRVERYSDDYDEIDPKGEGLKNDPAFQLAGVSAKQEASTDTSEDHRRRGRRPIWGRLRSSGNK